MVENNRQPVENDRRLFSTVPKRSKSTGNIFDIKRPKQFLNQNQTNITHKHTQNVNFLCKQFFLHIFFMRLDLILLLIVVFPGSARTGGPTHT
jgi:hypothetical protein